MFKITRGGVGKDFLSFFFSEKLNQYSMVSRYQYDF